MASYTGGTTSESIYAWDIPTIDEIRAAVDTLKDATDNAKNAYDKAFEQVSAGYSDDFGGAEALLNTMKKDSSAMELLSSDLALFSKTLNEVAELYTDGDKTIADACENTLSDVQQALNNIS